MVHSEQPTTTRLQIMYEQSVTITGQLTTFQPLISNRLSVNMTRQFTIPQPSTPNGRSVSATKQFIISQPSTSNNCSKINTTGQSTNSPRPTLPEACAAAQCISSRRLTSTDHASIWSHYMSSMHPESSSYDEYGTCLFSRRPTPTSHETISHTTSS